MLDWSEQTLICSCLTQLPQKVIGTHKGWIELKPERSGIWDFFFFTPYMIYMWTLWLSLVYGWIQEGPKKMWFSTQGNGNRATCWHFFRWLYINKEERGSNLKLVLILCRPSERGKQLLAVRGMAEEHLDSDVIQAAPESLQATVSQTIPQNRINQGRSAQTLSGYCNWVQKSKDTSHIVTGSCTITCLFGMEGIANLASCHQGFSEEHKVFYHSSWEILWEITTLIVFLFSK